MEEHRGEVDARFLLANERTLLAWIRTGLTLIAAGVAVREFGRGAQRHLAVTELLMLLGTAAVIGGGLRYLAADRALRAGDLPRTGRFPYVLAGSVALMGAALMVVSVVAR